MAGKAVSWEQRWSREAQNKQLPSLHGIVSKYVNAPGLIGMHGGLPPSDSFPFTSLTAGISRHAGAATYDDGKDSFSSCDGSCVDDDILQITDPELVAAAQQYNMQAQGYGPLVSWARDMVCSLHKPATLKAPQNLKPAAGPATAATAAASASIGAEVVITQGSSAAAAAEPAVAAAAAAPAPIGMDVVITQGSSAGLEALFRILLNPGDPVLLEEYTYAHVVEAHLLPMGCELLPVCLDGAGLVPGHLDSILTARQAAGLPMPRVLYTIPTGQNPTGSVMTPERMSEVYGLARKWDLVIIEDDAYFWLQYPHGPDNVPGLSLRPGLLSLDVDGRVVRLDTLAKLLGPGFRLGWAAGPPPLIAKVALFTAGSSIGANMLSQVMIHQLLVKWGRSGFEAFVKRLQRRYAAQAAFAAAAAGRHLSGIAEWQPVQAGMFMWVRMTGPEADSEALLAAVAVHGVMIVPGHLISVKHLAAAARKKQQQQQQGIGEEALLQTIQQLQLQQQQQHLDDNDDDSVAENEKNQPSSIPMMPIKTKAVPSPTSKICSSSNGCYSTVNSCRCSTANSCRCSDVEYDLAPSPYFRISFVSVGPEAIQEGIARIARAIEACCFQQQQEARPPSPATPPVSEVELPAAPVLLSQDSLCGCK